MNKTYKELYEIYHAIESLKKDKVKPAFALGLNHNKKRIKSLLETLEETFAQLSDEDKEKYKELQGKEKEVITDKSLSDTAKMSKIEELKDEYKDLVDKLEDIQKTNEELLKQEVEVEFYKIRQELLPEITLLQLEIIEDLIQE